MRLDISLKQTQKLAMTTELRQSIEILQYNHFELIDYLMKESEENPTLEVEVNNIELDFYSDYSNKSYSSREESDDEIDYEKYITKEENLLDYVYEQLILSDLNKEERKIGEYLLGMMDENGYIKGDFYEFSNKHKFSFDKVQKVLETLQTFYPTGICSTTLEECLLKQGQEKSYDELTLKIIKNDLIDVAENRVEFLSKKYSTSKKKIQDSFDKIKKLDPKPGKFLNIDSNPTKFIIPDVILNIVDGEIVVTLNEESFINVNKSSYYSNLLKENIDLSAKEYLKDKFKSTNWIIKSINQRRETILKVSKAICEKQKDYLVSNSHLKPMNMKEIANELEIHESTVSRTVNGKYIQTPQRVMELKEFFVGGFVKDEEEVSTDEIKLYIKTAIETEDKRKPISDQKITNNLNKLGYEISRRTVAKYRDSLGILSSSKRKRF